MSATIRPITNLAAAGIVFTPGAGLAGTNVQAALAELESEVVHKAGDETVAGTKTLTGSFNVDGTFRVKRDPWIDASHPFFAGGVQGTVSVDSTPAMTALLSFMRDQVDAAPKPWRNAISRAELPAGFIKVTDNITVEGFIGCHLRGRGEQVTYLRGFGEIDKLFDFDGWAYSSLGQMTIQGDGGTAGPADIHTVIHMRRDPTVVTQGVTQNELYSMGIQNCRFRTGIQVGMDGNSLQVDSTFARKVIVYGGKLPGDGETTYFQKGWRVGSTVGGNNFLHTFISCHVLNCAHGVENALSGVAWYGGSLGNNEVDFYLANGAPAYLAVRDYHCEGSQKVLDCQQASTACAVITFDTINMNGNRLPVDGIWFKNLIGGITQLRNIKISNVGATLPKISLSSGGTPAICQVTGLQVPIGTQISDLFTLGNNANIAVVRGITYTDTSGNVASVEEGAWTGSRPVGVVTWRHSERLNEVVKTASYTAALHDAGFAIAMNVAGANNFTVPPNATVPFPIGTRMWVEQMGAGQTTIVAGAGVTLRASGGKLKLAAQDAVAELRKKGTDEWVVSRDLVV